MEHQKAILASFCWYWSLGFTASSQSRSNCDTQPSLAGELARFDFAWFIPAIVKYRRVLLEALGAPAVLQLFGLIAPRMSQVLKDKVLANRAESTLLVVCVALVVCSLFGVILTCLRNCGFVHIPKGLTLMKFFLLALTAFGSFIIPSLARADWVALSAAAKCDKDHGVFSLVPVVRTSSEEYNVPAPKDFTEFGEQNNQSFICKLGKNTVNLSISRQGSQAGGQGQGGGVIIIESFSIDGKKIINRRTDFLWKTMGKPVLTQITVKKDDAGLEESYCYSNGFSWDKRNPIKDMKCQSVIAPD